MNFTRTFNNLPAIASRFKTFPFVAFILQMAALWSVWQWLGSRFGTSGDEFWGIFALLAAAFFSIFGNREQTKEIKPSALIFSSVCLLLYAFSLASAPSLVRGILAMTALTFTLSGWRFGRTFHFGLFTLLLLGLPLIASLNFYLGYPLRLIVGEAVEFLLRMQGLDVFREGVCLHFGEKLIWIDAPCSGIKMLWFGIFLTAILACFYRLKNLKTIFALALSFVAIVLGNIFRASALFYTEAEIIKAPQWLHEAVGVFAFAVTALGIVFIVKGVADFKWQKYFSS